MKTIRTLLICSMLFAFMSPVFSTGSTCTLLVSPEANGRCQEVYDFDEDTEEFYISGYECFEHDPNPGSPVTANCIVSPF